DDAAKISHRRFGFVALTAKAHRPGQGDDAAVHGRINTGWDECVPGKCLQHRSTQVGVCVAVGCHELHLELVVHLAPSVYSTRGAPRRDLRTEAADGASEGHHPVLDERGDLLVVDPQLLEELFCDVLPDVSVRFHRGSLLSGRGW